MSNIKDDLYTYAKNIYKNLESQLKKVDKNLLINSDGRKKNGHEGTKKGSFIYLLYDQNDLLLYVGETGTTIKNRLKADGDGSHFKKSPEMYNEVSYVKYIKGTFSPMERKMIEQALTIYLKPKYYNNKVWDY